ncbi:MAG: DotH/IcmK family type IV secretion protein [Alphaproteobacteria bacterium]
MAQNGTENADLPVLEDPAAMPGEEDAFTFDDQGFEFDKSTEELEGSFRKEAYNQALKTLMPLKPEEIRTLLEHFDRTVESTELPVHPYPRAESVVQNISLDPGVPPLTVKLAYGYVTTLSLLDVSGAPWPIEDISWVGDFVIEESVVDEMTHILRVSPQRKFAHGNVSMRLVGLDAPVIMTFETGRDFVHYRMDAVIPKRGPGAKTSIINRGITLSAGDPDMSTALSGIVPNGAEILNVSGVDGRTTAYVYNGMTYVRTPLTLLSPGWDSSVTSADGTNIYALEETPVILLSDRGRMVRAHLTVREDLLDE